MMTKSIYVDNGQLSQVQVIGLNLSIPLSETEKCNTAAYIECIIGHYSYHQPGLGLVFM